MRGPTKNKNSNRLVTSYIAYVVIAASLFIFFRADTGSEIPLVTWILKSRHPEFGIIALSILITSVAYILVSIGSLTKISIFNIKFEADPEKEWIPNYINLVPLPLLIVTTILSLGYLLFIPPACDVPNITFEVNMGSETKTYTPESEAIVGDFSSVIVTAKSDESNELACSLHAMGDSLERITPASRGCSSTIFLKDNPGSVLVSASVQEKYCKNSSFYSFLLRRP